jgi:predicted transposase YbfD/YdcC
VAVKIVTLDTMHCQKGIRDGCRTGASDRSAEGQSADFALQGRDRTKPLSAVQMVDGKKRSRHETRTVVGVRHRTGGPRKVTAAICKALRSRKRKSYERGRKLRNDRAIAVRVLERAHGQTTSVIKRRLVAGGLWTERQIR